MSVPNEVTFRLSRRSGSVGRARALLHAMFGGRLADQDCLEAAELVLSELVTNAIRVRVPPDRQVGVRIVHLAEDGLLRLEVSDAGGGRPQLRTPGAGETGGRGLLLVAALTDRWGFHERPGGIGKTVWAELKAPGLVPAAPERDTVAVTLRAGQQIEWRESWHTLREVRGERCASGGLVMLLRLADGPTLRLDAAAPLTVRDSGADGTR